jgi:hypothetical protein
MARVPLGPDKSGSLGVQVHPQKYWIDEVNFRPPAIMLKKYISNCDAAGIGLAEAEFERSVREGLPGLALSSWDRASFNDLRNGGVGVEIPHGPDGKLIFTYLGTRHALMGPYLYANISLSSATDLSVHAHELPFVKPMLDFSDGVPGLVVIGQTNPDLRSLAVISGRKSDVFAFSLGYASGLDNGFIEPGEELNRPIFPFVEVTEIARRAFEFDGVVHVTGWGRGRFLRQCFRELSSVMSRQEFFDRYAKSGVRWRPRSIFSRGP